MSAIKNISLYIPHVFPNFDKEYVTTAFKNIGEVSNIDFVAKQDRKGDNYNAVYVHFKLWYNNREAVQLYNDVLDVESEARLYHDEQWYWIVLPNTAKKYVPGERKPRIDLGDLNPTSVNDVSKDLSKMYDEEDIQALDDEAKMAEIEALIEEEDSYLVSIDSRYIQVMEKDLWQMRSEIAQLRAALINLDQMYQAEAAKVRAFSNSKEN
jgi:hypothetical protein